MPGRSVTTAVFGVCLGVSIDAWFRGHDVDVDRAATEITDLVFEGLFPRPDA